MRVIALVPREWIARVDSIARENGDSRATWIRQAIREKLERDTGSVNADPS